ncbi:MAG: flagellar biosynthesis protein FliQ [Dethiobacter sp.]|jgi:flagellar biosynthetic protein FliQ|nr:flagellar biosynthesis protein FliQ [Dethiobacter sp.]MBS3897296.1 flagellar biosynthesis protein FliQ [Dethiobacter sp.]MBS3982314.1 flagellar biosynthesis protein FliQ [Dethiobacter sp.]MCL4463778.1 flagellar biosynthesis protein FliQ [Bacillota bacterium]MCL5992688.1 flagellar biosynthesis protein FliQ [Bacillota bacterium]
MSEELVLAVAREAVLATLYISAPVLIVSLIVGLSVSVFQATTQIQEPTLTFVPKIVAVFISMLFFGGWMLTMLIELTLSIFAHLGSFGS